MTSESRYDPEDVNHRPTRHSTSPSSGRAAASSPARRQDHIRASSSSATSQAAAPGHQDGFDAYETSASTAVSSAMRAVVSNGPSPAPRNTLRSSGPEGSLGPSHLSADHGPTRKQQASTSLHPSASAHHRRVSSVNTPSTQERRSTRAPSGVLVRDSSRSAATSASPQTRWTATLQQQAQHADRESWRARLQAGIWNGRQFGPGRGRNASSGLGSGYLTRMYQTLRRLPDILYVESQDPVSPATVWQKAISNLDDEQDSGDTSDLLDDDGDDVQSHRSKVKRNQTHRQLRHGRRTFKILDAARRKMGMTWTTFTILGLLLMLGVLDNIYKSRSSNSRTSTASSNLILDPLNPQKTLEMAGIQLQFRSATHRPISSMVAHGSAQDRQPIGVATMSSRKATAILLNWKRLDNLIVIVAHLCHHAGTVFQEIHVFNNNPDLFLTIQDFSASKCPAGRLRISNSAGNMLFASRFFACAQAETSLCYFQDDDWLVPSITSLFAHHLRNPDGPVTIATGEEFVIKAGWEWCAFNPDYDLNTCFGWLGTGAFVSRAKVLQTLDAITRGPAAPLEKYGGRGIPSSVGPVSSAELALLDNAFTTLQNEPPYVIADRLVPLPQPSSNSFTAGSADGDARNEIYIQKGIDRLSAALGVPANLSPYAPPLLPAKVSIGQYATPSSSADAAMKPHTYRHHTRASSYLSDNLFMTNVALLPPPDTMLYQPHHLRNLSQWESALNADKHFWTEGREWALRWPYVSAVDGSWKTAFRSPDIIQAGDYIGLDVLKQYEVELQPQIKFSFALEHSSKLASTLKVEVSDDGLRWQAAKPVEPIACHMTGHLSSAPAVPFPKTYFTSASAVAVIGKFETGRSAWYLGNARSRIQMCDAILSTRMGGARRKGWRFVRLLATQQHPDLGWGVYHMSAT